MRLPDRLATPVEKVGLGPEMFASGRMGEWRWRSGFVHALEEKSYTLQSVLKSEHWRPPQLCVRRSADNMKTMSPKRHYQKAPITEAIIDLRVELRPDFPVSELSKAHEGQEAAYPTVQERHAAFGQMQVGPQVSAIAGSQHIGYLYRSGDSKQIYQARLDGFTMSRLAPYENWESLRDEARRLWDIYRSVAKPPKVSRLAVRYINRIDIPLPLRDFKDYLRTVPEVSPDLPQGLAGYFMQLTIPLEDIKSLALINETIIEPSCQNVVSVVLDIDIFRTADLPPDEEGIWAFFEELRDRKNQVFEACITDKARDLFQPCQP